MRNLVSSFYGKKSSGQVLLIVVITMIVALTAGLSIASQTITNLKISKQNEDSQRAFQAAQSGIERYLSSGTGGTNSFNNATFDTTVAPITSNELVLNNGTQVDQSRGIEVWLSDYPTYNNPYSGTFKVYWSTSAQTSCTSGQGTSSKPAIEIVILSNTKDNPILTKYAYDNCSRGNSFTAPNVPAGGFTTGSSSNIPNVTFLLATPNISVTNGLIMKIIPIYNSTVVAVKSTSGNLPSQGKIVESTGTSGDTKRKVVYYESFPQIPNEVFPYGMISQ